MPANDDETNGFHLWVAIAMEAHYQSDLRHGALQDKDRVSWVSWGSMAQINLQRHWGALCAAVMELRGTPSYQPAGLWILNRAQEYLDRHTATHLIGTGQVSIQDLVDTAEPARQGLSFDVRVTTSEDDEGETVVHYHITTKLVDPEDVRTSDLSSQPEPEPEPEPRNEHLVLLPDKN